MEMFHHEKREKFHIIFCKFIDIQINKFLNVSTHKPHYVKEN